MKRAGQCVAAPQANGTLLRSNPEKQKITNQVVGTFQTKDRKYEKKIIKNKNTDANNNKKGCKYLSCKNTKLPQNRLVNSNNGNQRPSIRSSHSAAKIRNKEFQKKKQQITTEPNEYDYNFMRPPKRVHDEIINSQKEVKVQSQPYLLKRQQNCQETTARFKKDSPTLVSSKQSFLGRFSYSAGHNKYSCQSPKQRFAKFEFRTEKYSKIVEQLRNSEVIESNPKQPKKLPPKLTKSKSEQLKTKLSTLTKQLQNYKILNSKSSSSLKKIQQIKCKQQQKFQKQKQHYLQQIKKLQEHLQEYRPNIGHLFTYKEHTSEKLVPDVIIFQECQDSRIGALLPNCQDEIRRMGEQVMKQYQRYGEDEDEDGIQVGIQSQVEELGLSIMSNELLGGN